METFLLFLGKKPKPKPKLKNQTTKSVNFYHQNKCETSVAPFMSNLLQYQGTITTGKLH